MISIIVPIYNVEAYLERCVQSIFNQTYDNYELILVDDGSPDRSGEMCEQYAKQDNRVKVIHKENGGLSDARNAGLEVAKGEHIVFVDSDDWLAPHYLEYLLKTAEETESDIVECEIVKTTGEPEEIVLEAEYTVERFKTEEGLKLLIEDSVFHQYVWNKIYKREVIGNIFFEKGKTNEDEFWTYQIFGKARQVAKIGIPLYYYFQRGTSIMGVGYNIRRLDAIEAKSNRQKYIESRFPDLATIAKSNLIGSCIYAGQMSLLHMDKHTQKTAQQLIDMARKCHVLSVSELRHVPYNIRLWMMMSKISFWGTCRLKNLLKKGL